ncbi:ABC transporter substrate-binding protein [Pseudarthrobacter raffinosi]|uniref:ABC transporter substrate-binding protein n=1 Tax=Pseudarthrobacter raffinosi TaxID=2953651 RepID=UPI00208F8108|nr:ABC transporter substrate-binding protein [Pseudarthrobacter sp. MDT3-9]MCO4251246.1 ABC transporter substrate-binding protein [Pseudarthrobacter sp. MDT3-9]
MLLTTRTKLVTMMLLAVTGTVAGCGAEAGTAEPNNERSVIKVVQPSAASDNLAFLLGEQNGVFEKKGIDIEFISAPQVGANQVASLLNGQLDVGIGSVTSTLSAVGKGLQVQVVSGVAADNEVNGRTLYEAIAKPDTTISSFKDLEGKTVALNSLKSTWQAAMDEAITLDGGDPQKVNYVQLTFPNQVTALKEGHVDAIFTTQPFATQLISTGFKRLGDPQALAMKDKQSVATIMQMSTAFIEKNPEAVKKFVAAMQESSDFANANPEAIKDLAVKQAGASGETAQAIKDSPFPHYTSEITAQNLDSWASLLVKYGYEKQVPSSDDILWTSK